MGRDPGRHRDSAGTVTRTWEPLLGAGLGIVTAIVLGYLIYRGAISIDLSRFFSWTGVFLILVGAGVLSYGVHDLQEARFLPGLNDLAFDVSNTVDPGTRCATLLKGIFNFSPVTTRLEAVAWLSYAIPTMVLFGLGVRRRSPTAPTATRTPAPAGAAAASAMWFTPDCGEAVPTTPPRRRCSSRRPSPGFVRQGPRAKSCCARTPASTSTT